MSEHYVCPFCGQVRETKKRMDFHLQYGHADLYPLMKRETTVVDLERKLDCLREKSSRPHSVRPFLDASHTEALKDLLHHSPRSLGKPTSLWTLDLVAEVCHQRGWTPRQLTGEAIRVALKRLKIRWRRAKHWITSPDPAYARKKKPATA